MNENSPYSPEDVLLLMNAARVEHSEEKITEILRFFPVIIAGALSYYAKNWDNPNELIYKKEYQAQIDDWAAQLKGLVPIEGR